MAGSVMKVLWFCNPPLAPDDSVRSGSWLGAMARGLIASGKVELGVVSSTASGAPCRQDCGKVRQWLVPSRAAIGKDGLPPASVVDAIRRAVDEFSPDVIHVWGTEYYYGLLTGRGILRTPAVLNTQGLKWCIARTFEGGMTCREQWAATGLRELARRITIPQMKRRFATWGEREKEIVRGHRHILHHTDWDAAQMRAVNPSATLHRIDLPLREAFRESPKWGEVEEGVVFTGTAYATPAKGLHVALRALAVLRLRVPTARLRIGGIARPRQGIRRDGYLHWFVQECRRLGLESAVEWLGPLDAEQMAGEMRRCAVMVVPTLAENACTTMQEAMLVGTPVVASYVGGIPSLGVHGESCLFFPPGDVEACADLLASVMKDHELACRLSLGAQRRAAERSTREQVVQRQQEVYELVRQAR